MNSFFKSSSSVKSHHVLENPHKKIIDLKKTFRLVKSHVSFYHCAWLLIILLFQICILLVFLTNGRGPSHPTTTEQFSFSPVSLREQQHHLHQQEQQHRRQEEVIHQLAPLLEDDGKKQEEQVIDHQLARRDDDHEKCKYGKVYVYDLPPMFNKELVQNCHDLNPWKSRCDAVRNDGFGPNATNLAGTVPQELTPSWWWTDMFASEMIYHTRMSNYKCRTTEGESATAFYVPFYAGLAVSKYLFTNYTPKERDYPFERFLGWIKDQPYWKRSNGSDHFIMLGRITWDFRRKTDDDWDWGTRFLFMPLMKNMLRLSIEQNRWDPLEISVPYPTGFHPRSASEIERWQEFVRSGNRSSLFTFVGARREKVKNDFRGLLLDHCYNESDSCRVLDCAKTPCSDGASAILEAFLQSNFCLQPKGDSDTRKSTFDCMLAGSIPVFFAVESFLGQYELFLSSEPETFSVFVDPGEVRNGTSIRRVLEGYSKEDVKMMRDKIIDFIIPRILFAFPREGLADAKDAFDITVEEVLQRIVKKPSIAGQ